MSTVAYVKFGSSDVVFDEATCLLKAAGHFSDAEYAYSQGVYEGTWNSPQVQQSFNASLALGNALLAMHDRLRETNYGHLRARGMQVKTGNVTQH